MSGFSTTVDCVPFSADDLWTELFLVDSALAPPLGCPPGTCVSLDPMAQTFLTGHADGKPGTGYARRVLCWPSDGTTLPGTLTMTEAEAVQDKIVYNLHECLWAQLVTWEIKEQRAADELLMHGVEGKPPRVSFEFISQEHGTEVRITFECARVTKRTDGWWWAADQMPELEKRFQGVGSTWAAEMQKRGYRPIISVPRLPIFSTVPRPPQLEVNTSRTTDSSRSTLSEGSTDVSTDGASQKVGPVTERVTSGQRLTARSKPFWQLERERQDRSARERREKLAAEERERARRQPPRVEGAVSRGEGAVEIRDPAPTATPIYGLRTFKVEDEGPFGLALQETKRKRWHGSSHLVVVHVIAGSVAEHLGVPVGSIVAGLNGRPLPPDADHKQLLSKALESSERPVYVSVYLQPPKLTSKGEPKESARASMRRSVFRMVMGKGRPSRSVAARLTARADAIKEKAKVTETPSATYRSGSSCETEAYTDDLADEMCA